jgi:hemerythrin-like domain-containing protein
MEESKGSSRRSFLAGSLSMAGSAILLNACGKRATNAAANSATGPPAPVDKDVESGEEKEVTALEDLMREHGILRRALLVYTSAAMRLKSNAKDVSPEALQKTAKLFRSFGEDYHEKQLEEAHIFPLIRQKGAGSAASAYTDVLAAQHQRGREITDHILTVTNMQKLSANAGTFADTLAAFVWMYENHAAREDTIVFPAWKDLLSEDDYKELGEKFEDIEKQQFGGDGFDMAVKEIGDIEASFGLSDISKFTAPSPQR